MNTFREYAKILLCIPTTVIRDEVRVGLRDRFRITQGSGGIWILEEWTMNEDLDVDLVNRGSYRLKKLAIDEAVRITLNRRTRPGMEEPLGDREWKIWKESRNQEGRNR